MHIFQEKDGKKIYRWKSIMLEKSGLEEGRKIGKKEAIEERNVQIVKNMLKMNKLIKEISEVTGLTEKEIKDIAESINKDKEASR